MSTEIFDLAVKLGSWRTAQQNTNNAWVAGADFTIRPDFTNLISFSMLTAVNYDTVTRRRGDGNMSPVEDPMANPNAIRENPIAFGLGYEYRLALPWGRQILRPYLGADFIYETTISEYNFEVGGGLQWFFRGTGAAFKRNDRIGGISIGDVDLPTALIVGFNADKNGIVNGIISLNESPHNSLIPRLGGFLNLELFNLTGREYSSWEGDPLEQKVYNDFLWAAMAQVEYLLDEKIMPYIFVRYIPGIQEIVPGFKIDPDPAPVYNKDYLTLTTKIGCQLMFFRHFTIDLWYERNDISRNNNWELDDGLLSINFRISM
jgi:hypothetical protein